MTTICVKNGIVAYDGRMASGDTIVTDSYDKKIIRDGVVFFLSGSVGDFPDFIQAYFDGETDKSLNVEAIVVDNKKLFLSSADKEEHFWKMELPLDVPYSVGSGHAYALIAMDMGCSAKQAVKQAMKRDCKTGGKVREYRIK